MTKIIIFLTILLLPVAGRSGTVDHEIMKLSERLSTDQKLTAISIMIAEIKKDLEFFSNDLKEEIKKGESRDATQRYNSALLAELKKKMELIEDLIKWAIGILLSGAISIIGYGRLGKNIRRKIECTTK